MKEIIKNAFIQLKDYTLYEIGTAFRNCDEKTESFCNEPAGSFALPKYTENLNTTLVSLLFNISSAQGFKVPNNFVPLYEQKVLVPYYPNYAESSYVDFLKAYQKFAFDPDFIDLHFFANVYLFNQEVVFLSCAYNKSLLQDIVGKSRGLDAIAEITAKEIKKAIGNRNVLLVPIVKRGEDDLDPSLLNNYLGESKYVFFEDYIKEHLPVSTCDYIFKQIYLYNDMLEYLKTKDGAKFVFKKVWHSINGSLRYILDKDSFIKDDSYGLTFYFDKIDFDKDPNIDWMISLMTSEKLFNSLRFYPAIDNTVIITGYLKSVEQLLTQLIIEDAQKNNYEPVVEYYDEYERKHTIPSKKKSVSQLMLGEILLYIEHSNFFLPEKNDKNSIVSKLSPWIRYTRNGFFHKDIIVNPEKIIQARSDTLFVIKMILNAAFKPT